MQVGARLKLCLKALQRVAALRSTLVRDRWVGNRFDRTPQGLSECSGTLNVGVRDGTDSPTCFLSNDPL